LREKVPEADEGNLVTSNHVALTLALSRKRERGCRNAREDAMSSGETT